MKMRWKLNKKITKPLTAMEIFQTYPYSIQNETEKKQFETLHILRS